MPTPLGLDGTVRPGQALSSASGVALTLSTPIVVDGGTPRRLEVHVGIAGATNYEILEGLSEGARVAMPGETELRDGLTVVPVEQK